MAKRKMFSCGFCGAQRPTHDALDRHCKERGHSHGEVK